MRKMLLLAAAVAVGALTYPASGFHAAWQIREAVRTGDTATLTQRVDFEAVRQSLKRSANETRQLMVEMSEAAGVPKPGLWQRIKAATVPFLADPIIDRYVTAEGAPQIWAWRQTWRQKVRPSIGLAEPATPLGRTWLAGTAIDRNLALARRVDRVALVSPARMEFDVRDRYVEGRSWRAALELRGLTWTLTDVEVRRITDAPRPVGGVAELRGRGQ